MFLSNAEIAIPQSSGPARRQPRGARARTRCDIKMRGCLDSLRGSSVEIGTIQRRLAWPLRKDDAHKSRSVIICLFYVQNAGLLRRNHLSRYALTVLCVCTYCSCLRNEH